MADSSTLIDTTPAKKQVGLTAEGWLTDSWYLACVSSELKPGQQVRRIVLGQPLVVARTAAGEVFALRDICPHRLVPLSAGRQVETEGEPTLECPYHGWRFGSDGVCRHMPSLTGSEPYDPSKVKVRRYPVHEAHGAIYVFIADDPRFAGPVDVPVPQFGPLPEKPKLVIEDVFNAHMDDAVVGLMDPAHVPFVHNQWWWRPPSVGLKLKEKPFIPADRGWAIDRHKPSSNSKLYKWVFGDEVETVYLVDRRAASASGDPDRQTHGAQVPASGWRYGRLAESRHGASESDDVDR